MFAKLRLYIVFAVLITVFSSGAYAADKIYPDSSSGEYTYTYETGVANEEFAVFVVKGLLDDGDVPVINMSSVIYYNVFNSDNTGKLEITFIPSVYTDATLVLASYGQTSPVILCHVMQGAAKDIEDWDSLEHITLIGAVEREFKVKFTMKEVSSMKNVGEMADLIAARAK